MITDLVPAVAPLGIWDIHEEWFGPLRRERSEWAQGHFPNRAEDVYRAEFYLVDAPFAVLFQYAQDKEGRRFFDPATDEAAVLSPITFVLTELPPRHLLERGA